MNYFELDKYNLDEEWINQPKYYYEAATRLARKRAEYERAKVEKELVEAELSKEIRSNPTKFGLDKTTENSIRETIVVSDRYKEAINLLIHFMEEKDIAEVDVWTLDHRKKALENEVQLFLASYYSNPKVPKEGEKMKQVERDRGFRRNRKEN